MMNAATKDSIGGEFIFKETLAVNMSDAFLRCLMPDTL